MPVRVLNDEIDQENEKKEKKRERERSIKTSWPKTAASMFYYSIVDDLSIDDDDATKKNFYEYRIV